MSFGLTYLHEIPQREVRPQFQILVDPFIKEAFTAVMALGHLSKLTGWSRSYYTISGHLETIQSYNKVILPEPTNDAWTRLKLESFEYFRNIPKVDALDALKDFDRVKFHESTSAGYGYSLNPGQFPTHKGPINGPQHGKAKRICSKIVHECVNRDKNGTFDQFLEELPNDSVPDIAFTRTQLAEFPDMKIRNVFGECFHYVILEGLFAQVLIQFFMRSEYFYFIGFDPVSGVPDLVNQLPDRDQYFLSLDWSKFDASVMPYEIDLAFDLIESMINFPNHATYLVFKYVRRLFMKRKLASPDGRVYMRYGAIPSGSYFTHLIGSIVNWNRIRYLFILHRIEYGLLKTHGDDALVELRRFDHDCLNLMVDDAHAMGWYIKRDKTQLFKDRSRIVFLGRSTLHGRNTRDADRCLRLMYYPEYPVSDPQISIARLKAIDADSGYSIPEIPLAYNYLSSKYGDHFIELPKKFRPFKIEDATNVSI